jgi:uncharacterized protein (TIGR02117 family)
MSPPNCTATPPPSIRPRAPIWLAKLCLLCALAGAIASCTPLLAPPYAGTAPRSEVIYVIRGGWHTELALPMSAIRGPLAALNPGFAKASYLVFGWGARGYYMARHPGLADLLRALVPGPAVLLVIPLQVSPAAFAGAENAFAIPAAPAGVARLSAFLWRYLAKDAAGAPRPIDAGLSPGSVFYASTGTFDLAHTCNTWTAEALRAVGLPVSSVGVVYAQQLVEQLPPLAAAMRRDVPAPRRLPTAAPDQRSE